MFHPDYKCIFDKLPISIVNRSYQRLLHHSHKPIPPEQISEKNERIEEYLRHTLKIYQNSLDRKRTITKTMDQKKPRPVTNVTPECSAPLSLPIACNHEEEINSRVKNELIIWQKQLLNYNNETFARFMQELTREHDERIKANQQLRNEIKNMKMQVLEAEKILASMAGKRKK
jgi:hypothetical protein